MTKINKHFFTYQYKVTYKQPTVTYLLCTIYNHFREQFFIPRGGPGNWGGGVKRVLCTFEGNY